MKTYWRRRPLNDVAPTKEPAESRLIRYLGTWPSGLSTDRMGAWIASCSRGGGYSEKEYQAALTKLRDSGRIAIANGTWYARSQKPKQENK